VKFEGYEGASRRESGLGRGNHKYKGPEVCLLVQETTRHQRENKRKTWRRRKLVRRVLEATFEDFGFSCGPEGRAVQDSEQRREVIWCML
jgi:hypothetical protein